MGEDVVHRRDLLEVFLRYVLRRMKISLFLQREDISKTKILR